MDFETKQNNLVWYSLTYALPLQAEKVRYFYFNISKWIEKEKNITLKHIIMKSVHSDNTFFSQAD